MSKAIEMDILSFRKGNFIRACLLRQMTKCALRNWWNQQPCLKHFSGSTVRWSANGLPESPLCTVFAQCEIYLHWSTRDMLMKAPSFATAFVGLSSKRRAVCDNQTCVGGGAVTSIHLKSLVRPGLELILSCNWPQEQFSSWAPKREVNNSGRRTPLELPAGPSTPRQSGEDIAPSDSISCGCNFAETYITGTRHCAGHIAQFHLKTLSRRGGAIGEPCQLCSVYFIAPPFQTLQENHFTVACWQPSRQTGEVLQEEDRSALGSETCQLRGCIKSKCQFLRNTIWFHVLESSANKSQ